MIYYLLALLFLPHLFFAENFPLVHSPLLTGSVHLMTGEYIETSKDLCLMGPKKIDIVKTFQGNNFWSFNQQGLIYSNENKTRNVNNEEYVYRYDLEERLIKMSIYDKHLTKKYHEICFDYEKNDESYTCTGMLDDGRTFSYDYHFYKNNREGNPLLVVDSYTDCNQNITKYYYQHHPIERSLLLKKVEDAEGGYLEAEYYDGKYNNANGVLVSLSDGIRDHRIGKIKLLKSPVGPGNTPLVTQTFFYSEGYTDVVYANNLFQRYHYTKDHYITKIETSLSNSEIRESLYKTEYFEWTKQEENKERKLLKKWVTNHIGEVHSFESYFYNSHDQLIEKRVYGIITGESLSPIQLDEQNNPINTECSIYTYEYDEKGNLYKNTEPSGRISCHLYDEENRETTNFIGDATGIKLRRFFLYNEEGLLCETITDDGKTENANDLHSISERHIVRFDLIKEGIGLGMPGEIAEYTYDLALGKEVLNRKIDHQYSSNNQITLQLIKNSNDQILSKTCYEYDFVGRCILKKNENETATFKYDKCGRKIKESIKTSEGKYLIRYFYDIAGRLIRKTESHNQKQDKVYGYKYDSMNNCVAEYDQKGNFTSYNYDALGRLKSVIYPAILTEEGKALNPKIEYEHDLMGNVIEITDQKGYKTVSKYNIEKKPLEVCFPDGTIERFFYDLAGNLSSKIEKNGTIKKYTYDYQNRVIQETAASSSGDVFFSKQNVYNAFHLIQSSDSTGLNTYYKYSHNGLLIEEIRENCENKVTIKYEYNSNGELTKETFFGNCLEDSFYKVYLYINGQLTETQLFDFAGNLQKAKAVEDSEKKCSALNKTFPLEENEVDADGNEIFLKYDFYGKLTNTYKKNSIGKVVEETFYFYDLLGNCIKEIYKNGHNEYIILKNYGSCNRLISIIEGAGSKSQRTTFYQYNSKGQIEVIINPNGTSLHHLYDEKGLLERFYASDKSFDYEYTYDSYGNLILVMDKISGKTTKRVYDSVGNVIYEKLENDLELTYAYDALGRNIKYSLPDDSYVVHSYNASELKEISRFSKQDNISYSCQFSKYNLLGLAECVMLNNGLVSIDYGYSSEGVCQSISSAYYNENIFLEKNDATPLITQKKVKDLLGSFSKNYKYDSKHALLSETDESMEMTYAFDVLENRVEYNGVKLCVNDVNQLTFDGVYTYEYDLNGNLIKKYNSKTCFEFFYDPLNRLVTVIHNKIRVDYTYDSSSRRLEKRVFSKGINDKWTFQFLFKYFYHHHKEIGSTDANGKILTFNLLNPEKDSETNASVSIETNENVYCPIIDTQGNIVAIINNTTRKVEEFYRYTAFGEEEVYNKSKEKINPCHSINPWRFAGKRMDKETGFIFFGKRFYSPSTGRWTTLDRIGYEDGVNRYAFVHNNALSYKDHFGLLSVSSAWQGFTSLIKFSFHSFRNFISKISYEEKILNDIQSSNTHTMEKYLGRGFLTVMGYYTHPVESGVYGQKEASDHVRITAINGILNTRAYFAGTLDFISKIHGGANLHYVFRASSGWSNDLLKGLFIKFGYVSVYAKELASTWKKLIKEMGGIEGDGKILHYCHSLGAADTIAAASLLTPEEKQMIDVISFGSATIVSDHVGFQHARNYISLRDGVTMFADPVGYFKGAFSKPSNLYFVGSFNGLPLIDHPLAVESYTSTITNLGQLFLKMYANTM